MRQTPSGAQAVLEPGKLSGVLIELAPGATEQQVRFAILANFPGVKVVAGKSMLTWDTPGSDRAARTASSL